MSARPFQVGDEVLVDGEPGVIAEMRDEAVRVDSTHALVEMTGFPFPAWDAVALSPDRTRMVGSRQIELVRPAPEPDDAIVDIPLPNLRDQLEQFHSEVRRASSQAGLASIRHGVVPMDDAAGVLELAHEVVRAAHRWEESYDQSSGTHSAIRTGQLMGAVRAHRAAGGAS